MMGIELVDAEPREVMGGRGEGGVGEPVVTSEEQGGFSGRPDRTGHGGQRRRCEFTEPAVEDDGWKEIVTVSE